MSGCLDGLIGGCLDGWMLGCLNALLILEEISLLNMKPVLILAATPHDPPNSQKSLIHPYELWKKDSWKDLIGNLWGRLAQNVEDQMAVVGMIFHVLHVPF